MKQKVLKNLDNISSATLKTSSVISQSKQTDALPGTEKIYISRILPHLRAKMCIINMTVSAK